MKKFFTLVAATFLAALSLVSFESYGSHAVGVDVTYEYVGPNQFLVTVRFYRDCEGIPAPPNVQVSYNSSCFSGGTATLNPIPGTGLEIPPSPCLPPVTTACSGGTGYGVQEWVYQGLITLPGACANWEFVFTTCCRNQQINTLVGAAGLDIWVSTTLDNLNAPTNSSPVFSNIPVTQFCVGNQFYYNQGATDIDGDSLVFSLVAAQGGPGAAPVPYQAPYSPTYPLASLTPITIDSQTGLISFTPSTVQVGVIAVLCEEYRNGTKIGQVKRDIQMNVVAGCIGSAPVLQEPVDSLGNPAPYFIAQCGDTSIYIITDIPIQCGSVVPTDIRILTPQGLLNPVLSATPINCVNGQTDSILVTFFYPLTVGTTYAFTKEGFDNNTFLSECGVEMPEFDSVAFNVIDPGIFNIETIDVSCTFDDLTITFDYEISCQTVTPGGTEFYLIDANGTNYPVTAITNCPGGNGYSSTITFDLGTSISPATPVYLIVQTGSDANTFQNRCGTFIQDGDTLAVLNVLNNLILSLGPDITICDSDPLPTLDAGTSGLTYSWTLNGNPVGGNTQTLTASQSGTYIVNASATAVCQGSDTIQVTINTTPVVALGLDITLCATDPIPPLNAGNTGAIGYTWYLNGTVITGANGQFYQPAGPGIYVVQVDNGGACVGSDTIEITVQAQLIIDLGLDATICSTDPLPLLNSGVPNGTYVWTLNGNPIGGNTPTLQTTGPGTYAVQVTSISGCTGTDTYTLTVIQAPIVDLGNDTTICATDILILDAQNAGASSFQWSLNGSPIPGANGQTYQPTQSGTYSVLVNTGGQCDATGDIIVTIVPQLTVSVSDVALCSTDPFPTLDANVTGVNYAWVLNGNTVGTGQTFQPTQAGTYDITISIGSCTATDQFVVTVIQTPTVTLTDASACGGDAFPILDAGNNGSSFVWSTGENTQTINPNAAGTYTVTVTNSGSGVNCSSSASATFSQFPGVIVALGGDTINCGGQITFDAGNPGSTYSWNYNGSPTGFTGQVFTPGDPGTYAVLVTDPNGCTGTDEVIYGVCDITIPNVFTPGNNDGKNDTFFIKNLDSNPFTQVIILNRWGVEVYSSSNYQNDWDAKDLPDGTYFYVVVLKNGKDYKGTVKLIREE
jgi:gliding motility-associated-like protein